MRLLIIGDVVGKPGRVAVLERLQDIKEQYAIDITTLNAENVAGGFSITPAIADQLFAAGVDLMTSGNHIFDKPEIIPYMERQRRLIRPANYPPETPGAGMWVGEIRGFKLAIINLLGRIFMQPADDPFRTADELLASLSEDAKVRIVDMQLHRTDSDYRTILLVQPINLPRELSAFYNVKVCLVEPCYGGETRAGKFCQGTEKQSIEY